MTWRSSEDHAKETDPFRRRVAGMIRRFVITLSSASSSKATALWQVLGHKSPTAGDEVLEIEIFPGIGFYSRPPSSGSPEAIGNAVGGYRGMVAVATRDEKTRQAVAGAIGEDETMVFNSQAVVYVKADGTIEARTAGGVAAPLATKADLDNLKAAILSWTPVANDGGAALRTKLQALFTGPPTWPAGTTTLKGE